MELVGIIIILGGHGRDMTMATPVLIVVVIAAFEAAHYCRSSGGGFRGRAAAAATVINSSSRRILVARSLPRINEDALGSKAGAARILQRRLDSVRIMGG